MFNTYFDEKTLVIIPRAVFSISRKNNRGNEGFTEFNNVAKLPRGDANTEIDEKCSKSMANARENWKFS